MTSFGFYPDELLFLSADGEERPACSRFMFHDFQMQPEQNPIQQPCPLSIPATLPVYPPAIADLVDGGVRGPKQEVNSCLAEGVEALNGQVLLVLLGVKDLLLGLSEVGA